ncbi:hypothetical protein E6C50_15980 [Flavobacterium supellecticarium]|uniref:Uncharacterized protein n=1 Tax=Flavobacterium supellecticarium TaxID=2565924 RepID=A0A4S3ZQT0_9FLAO|nr:hypothetical protein [Flavobacterium supellecticarium]THF47931.1 hypothetical protein E6C50_15980 [Flavobacterium supellecticarium]
MKEVKEIIEYFIDTEEKIEVLLRNRNLIEHNILVDKILEISGEDLFLAEKKFEPLSMILEMSIKENANLSVAPRYLFKISEHNNEKYGTVWACYVSFSNPNESIKKINECFLVASINDELKIVSDFIVSSDAKEWKHVDGDEDKSLRLHSLGKPVKVARYLEPNDEWSLKEYLK